MDILGPQNKGAGGIPYTDYEAMTLIVLLIMETPYRFSSLSPRTWSLFHLCKEEERFIA